MINIHNSMWILKYKNLNQMFYISGIDLKSLLLTSNILYKEQVDINWYNTKTD